MEGRAFRGKRFPEGAPSDLDAAESSGSPVEVVVDVTNLVSVKVTVPVKVNIRSRGLTSFRGGTRQRYGVCADRIVF